MEVIIFVLHSFDKRKNEKKKLLKNLLVKTDKFQTLDVVVVTFSVAVHRHEHHRHLSPPPHPPHLSLVRLAHPPQLLALLAQILYDVIVLGLEAPERVVQAADLLRQVDPADGRLHEIVKINKFKNYFSDN